MIRSGLFLLLMLFAFGSLAQPGSATLLTKITNSAEGSDTTKRLFCRSNDQWLIYTVNGNNLSTTSYTLDNGYLYIRSAESTDSLRIQLVDATHTVAIGSDRYLLFPAYYQTLKSSSALSAVFTVWADTPFDDWFAAFPNLNPVIQKATLSTARSQSELKDHWTGRYFYQKGRLDSLSISSGQYRRLTKKVIYKRSKLAEIRIYQNLEDRQITERTFNYSNGIQWRERVYEPGKDRETTLSGSLRSRDLGRLSDITLSAPQVLQLINYEK